MVLDMSKKTVSNERIINKYVLVVLGNSIVSESGNRSSDFSFYVIPVTTF